MRSRDAPWAGRQREKGGEIQKYVRFVFLKHTNIKHPHLVLPSLAEQAKERLDKRGKVVSHEE